MSYPLYRFLRPIVKFLMKILYCIEIVDGNNIPKEGSYILAGNHKNNFDCAMLIASTRDTIHFMAKKELLETKFAWFFRKIGIIPVDRKAKNKAAMEKAIELLNDGMVIGIFPEGTFNNTPFIVRPFKMGAVKMAKETNSLVVPFAIIGEYKLFRKSVKIVYGKPYRVESQDLKGENIILMNKVISLLKNGSI